MDLAVFGPMPGRVSSWAIVAVLRLMGRGGSFLGEGDVGAKRKNDDDNEQGDLDSRPKNSHDKKRDASWQRTAGGRSGTNMPCPY